MNARQEAITAALRAAGCTCRHTPTWTWTNDSTVRCGCGRSVRPEPIESNRTTHGDKHSEACRSLFCPCYLAGANGSQPGSGQS